MILRLTIEQVKQFPSVQKWLYGKRKYKSVRMYTKWIIEICHILERSPDELINNIKNSERPITEIINQHLKLTKHYQPKGLDLGTIDKRTNMLHGFYRANGIGTTSELLRELGNVVWRTWHNEEKKG